MWRITGDRKWQDEGWKMFVKWVQHAITESGL
jgi:mannosyl-oligosaccharide alpha-1,2-mannosidase